MTAENVQKPAEKDAGKIEKMDKELTEKTKLAEERLDQLKYLQADFDNYRKNFEREKVRITELADEGLISELLVIVDDFERCLQSIENGKDKAGLEMLHRNFLKILEAHGLERIDALGKKLDTDRHEVLMKEKSDKEDGTVLEEMQPGYMLKSKVIRYSKVKVSENKNRIEKGVKNG